MYDLSKELGEFYETHVRLGKTRRDQLASFRDTCLTHLKSGIDLYNQTARIKLPYWTSWQNQGGYQMGTLNQAVGNDYDLDVALIFKREDLPDDPRSVRERIQNAFRKTTGRFKEPPTARENAVTVWYADGQHLDFAIYRVSKGFFGQDVYEHAGGDEWNSRNPNETSVWFDAAVSELSPSPKFMAKVEAGQLKRIVRFAKFFNKSRLDWRHPGGLVTSALIAECYRPNDFRDDIALLDTLESLHYRLLRTTYVENPPDRQMLIRTPKRQREVDALRDRLGEILPKLAILKHPSCTREQARNAWRQFFNHDFWAAANDKATGGGLLRKAGAAPVPLIAKRRLHPFQAAPPLARHLPSNFLLITCHHINSTKLCLDGDFVDDRPYFVNSILAEFIEYVLRENHIPTVHGQTKELPFRYHIEPQTSCDPGWLGDEHLNVEMEVGYLLEICF